jgi:hypothetical protein
VASRLKAAVDPQNPPHEQLSDAPYATRTRLALGATGYCAIRGYSNSHTFLTLGTWRRGLSSGALPRLTEELFMTPNSSSLATARLRHRAFS